MAPRTPFNPILKHYGRTQIGGQLLIDTLIALAGLYLFTIERTGSFSMPYQVLAFVLALLMVIIYQWMGVYLHLRTGGFLREARSLAQAWLIVLFLLATIGFVTKTNTIYSREVMLKLAVAGYVGQLAFHMCLRFALRLIRSHGHNLRKAILVGSGPQTLDFAQRILRNPWMGIEIAGYVNDRPMAEDLEPELQQALALKYLGTMQDITHLARLHRINVLFVTLPLGRSEEIASVVQKLAPLHVDVQWVPDMTSFELLNHSVREIEGQPVLCLTDSPITGLGRLGKWLEDKVLASLILVLSSPVLVAIALAVKLTSRGPVFFRQKRAGLNGAEIQVYKFRTMYVHDEPEGVITHAQRGDSRITPLGALLRRTSLDEFPQFFNVLLGDMSIVGPRPHALEHHDVFEKQVEAYMLRHRIKPGITGWAQVNGWRGGIDQLHKIEMRVKYDLQYMNNWSFTFDLLIIGMTAWAVIAGKNAY